jgi:hypothetical protein
MMGTPRTPHSRDAVVAAFVVVAAVVMLRNVTVIVAMMASIPRMPIRSWPRSSRLRATAAAVVAAVLWAAGTSSVPTRR